MPRRARRSTTGSGKLLPQAVTGTGKLAFGPTDRSGLTPKPQSRPGVAQSDDRFLAHSGQGRPHRWLLALIASLSSLLILGCPYFQGFLLTMPVFRTTIGSEAEKMEVLVRRAEGQTAKRRRVIASRVASELERSGMTLIGSWPRWTAMATRITSRSYRDSAPTPNVKRRQITIDEALAYAKVFTGGGWTS